MFTNPGGLVGFGPPHGVVLPGVATAGFEDFNGRDRPDVGAEIVRASGEVQVFVCPAK